MLPIDLPPDIPQALEERVICSVVAAEQYKIPANIVLAVAEQEGGRPGQWVSNTNGTEDVGPMQFNTMYLSELNHRYGITAADVAAPGCYSYKLAAWRLRGHILNDNGDIWTKAANYHSRTPKYNTKYRSSLIKRGYKWAAWLAKHYDVTTKNGIAVLNSLPRGFARFKPGHDTNNLKLPPMQNGSIDYYKESSRTLARSINKADEKIHRNPALIKKFEAAGYTLGGGGLSSKGMSAEYDMASRFQKAGYSIGQGKKLQ